jgi:hypothetical protein
MSDNVEMAPKSRPEGAALIRLPSLRSEEAAAVPDMPSAAKQSSLTPPRRADIPETPKPLN